MKGWECPKCGSCWAPTTEGCRLCDPRQQQDRLSPLGPFELDRESFDDILEKVKNPRKPNELVRRIAKEAAESEEAQKPADLDPEWHDNMLAEAAQRMREQNRMLSNMIPRSPGYEEAQSWPEIGAKVRRRWIFSFGKGKQEEEARAMLPVTVADVVVYRDGWARVRHAPADDESGCVYRCPAEFWGYWEAVKDEKENAPVDALAICHRARAER